MKAPGAQHLSADWLERAEAALERRHTRQAERIAEAQVRENPADPRAVGLLARCVAARGQIQRAIRLLTQAGLEAHPDLNLVLARILTGAGRWQDARDAYVRGLRQRPEETSAWLELADLLQQHGDGEAAIDAYANGIRSDPMRQEGYLRLGALLQRRHAWHRAIAVYREGLEVLPRSPELLCDLGAALLSVRRVDEAVAALERSLSLKPISDTALFNLGSALLERGDFLPAERRFEQLLKLRPHQSDAWYRKVLCRPQTEADREEAAAVAARVEGGVLEAAAEAVACYGLARLHDDLDEAEIAWRWLERANGLREAMDPHDPDTERRAVDGIIDGWPDRKESAATLPVSKGEGLVILVGQPRSGLRLLDQVLGAHSQVASLRAHAGLERVIAALERAGFTSRAEQAGSLDPGRLERLRMRFEEAVQVSAPLMLDRSPGNAMNLGLLLALYPSARVIELRRDWRDLAVSQFATDFGDQVPWSRDLDRIRAAQGEHERLMTHWAALYGEQIFAVRYEALVRRDDRHFEELLDFLGLEHEAALEDFHLRRNAVAASSAWALRQPLGERAIGRWRRYAPFVDAFGDA